MQQRILILRLKVKLAFYFTQWYRRDGKSYTAIGLFPRLTHSTNKITGTTVFFTELGGNTEKLPYWGWGALSPQCTKQYLTPFLKYTNLMPEVTYIFKRSSRAHLVQNIK